MIQPVARLARLSAIGVLAYGSYQMCRTPILPLFARELGASPAEVGLVMAASTVTGVVLKFPAGALSDLVGRRAVLLTGALVFALLPLSYLAVGGLMLLAAIRAVHGSATALFGPVAAATLSDEAPPGQRGRWLALYSSAQGAGQALGPVVATSLIVGSDYSRAFIVSAALGTAALVLTMRWPAAAERPRAGTWRDLVRGARSVLTHRAVLVTSLAQAGQFFVHGTLTAFLPLYAHEELGFAPVQIGWLFAVQTAATFLARPLLGAISDRAGRRPLIVSGLLGCAACMALIPLASSFVQMAAITLAYGTGVALTTAATSAYITDLTERARYGSAHGLFGTIYDIGDALGPIGAGFVVAQAGYPAAFGTAGLVAAGAAGVFVLAGGRARGRAAPSVG